MDKKHLASISILVKDRQTNAPEMNQILTENGHFILARLGINLQPKCIEHCTAMITIIVEGTAHEIHELTTKLNDLYGIVAKASIMTE